MVSIVFGLIAICLGLWGIGKFWWYFLDIVTGFIPVILIFIGTVAIVSGARNSNLSFSISRNEEKPVADRQHKTKKA